ncbi:ribonuclease R [Acetilactobacillus jinshanensis]|uniref:ribonuclease R n=1 Tax=Acetilactobacillus jinshanensis TaxID=1720083 RepID=UPI003CE46F8F
MVDSTLKLNIVNILRGYPKEDFTVEKIAQRLGYSGSAAFKMIVPVIAELEREKMIIVDKDKFHINPTKLELEGTFNSNPKGFGFVRYDDTLPDAYIAPDHTMHAMNGDVVDMRIIRPAEPGSKKGPEGAVDKIKERSYSQVVGAFAKSDDKNFYGQVKLKDHKLQGLKFYVNDVGLKPTPGEVITADITEYPNDDHPDYMVGVAKEIIGSVDDPGIDILQIVYSHKVPSQFPENVLQEADAIPDHVTKPELKGREDITHQKLITIDGDESKDLDDAGTAWKLPNGNYHLGVHIADVGHYVKAGSAIDKEAFKRGTSVYLTDRVIPMLPRRLSNGICSLFEGKLRLCMSCEMEITPKGDIIKSRIHPSYMRSDHRMTYNEVNAILEKHDPEMMKKYADVVPMLQTMAHLHKILLKHRQRLGAISFDNPEPEIIVDKKGHPIDVRVRHRGIGERMVESMMLAANETVAKTYYKKHVPFIYRVHENPDKAKVKDFINLLNVLGIEVHGDLRHHIKPKTFQKILDKVAGTPQEPVISVMMLRSMQKPRYTDQELGHFGLAMKYYTHFTSPIRRYPDTMVNRMIHYYGKHGINDQSKAHFGGALEAIADHSSECEVREVQTERDTDSMKEAEYMADHIGEVFNATVSSVMKFGMFIQLPNTIEGLVHISRMNDDFYKYVDKYMALVGVHTRRTYRIGQTVKVKVIHVDVDQSQIDFTVVDPEDAPKTNILPPRHSHGHRHFNNHFHGHGYGHFGSHNHDNNNDDHKSHGFHHGHFHGHNHFGSHNDNHANNDHRSHGFHHGHGHTYGHKFFGHRHNGHGNNDHRSHGNNHGHQGNSWKSYKIKNVSKSNH